jgi:hypothetical protein
MPVTTINEDGSVAVTLDYPLRTGDEPITVVTIRRPKGKDLRLMSEKSSPSSFWMLAQLSGQAVPILDQMDGADLTAMFKVVDDFLEPSPRTGEAS